MATERKAILSTLDGNKQLVLPTTASVSGYDLSTGKLVYFNTGSNAWSIQQTISGSNGLFTDLTASNLRLIGNPGTIVNEVGPLLISSSIGITTSGSIIFSGSRSDLGTEQTSVLVNGDIFVSGGIGTNDYLQLKPVGLLRIPTNTTSSYIYTSGSTNDLYFTQYNGPYTNTTRLRWIEGGLSTGLLHGGVLSTVNGTTTFSVTSGSGIILDFNASTTTEPYPTVKNITWPLSSSIPLYYSASAQITYVGIDTNGQIVQRTSPFSGIDYQDYISLGRILHQSNAVSNGTITSPFVAYGQSSWNADFNRAFGPLKISGHTLAPSGSGITLAITKSAGDSYVEGRNYTTDPNNPNLILGSVEGAQLSSKIFRIYSDTSGTPTILNNGNLGYTDIEPGKYNPGNLGVTSSVGSGKFTIQRVFWFPNSVNKAFFVYYGTTEYATLDAAQSSIPTDFFIEGANTAGAAILVAYLIVAYNATNLNSSTQARILQAGLFRNNGIGGGGGGATTPGGSDTYVQFNNNGTFGGDADFTFNTTTNTLSATNIQVSGIVGASGSVTLCDASSDIVTVTGQLTASQGISASTNISTAGNLLVQGITQLTGSLIASKITGSLSGTVAGNPFIVAGSNITTNYNSLGQWEITGSGLSSVNYAMQGSTIDYTIDANYAPANLTASNGGSVTDQLGDGTVVPYFYGIHKGYISTLSRSVDGVTITHTNTNSLSPGQQIWPHNDVGPTLIIPLEDYKDLQVDINISFNLASFAAATGGDWCEANVSLCAEDYFDRLPYRIACVSMIGFVTVSGGNVSELARAWAKDNDNGESFVAGYVSNFLDVSTSGEGTVGGITTRHYRIISKGPIAKVYTGPNSSTLTYRGAKFNSKVRSSRNNMVLSVGVGQYRSPVLDGLFFRVNSLSLTKL